MRNRRAFWKYYKDVTIFNLVFSIIFGIISNYFWGLISFCSLGIIIGLLGFQYFKKQEYYLYLNLGYTKLSLIKNTFVLN
ncbi:hypothetical protein, partial [Zhouia amylolytica]